MLRPRILRTLLYKEVLRYRYNWGLLVVVFALIALAALVSLGGENEMLTGQVPAGERKLRVVCPTDSPWGEYLRQHLPPGDELQVDFRTRLPASSRNLLAVELFAPGEAPAGEPPVTAHTVRFWHRDADASNLLVCQDWIERESAKYLGRQPAIEMQRTKVRSNKGEIVPLVITGLVAFALYLPAFNLFITSTGEEREKKQLLALLLSPVRPLEMVVSKAIFYAAGSLFVSLTVVALYKPALVIDPRLVLAVLFGSVGYVAIGTVLISYIRRQTTISTVSMLYLMGVGAVVSLAKVLPIFNLLRFLLIENYLYLLLQLVLTGEPPARHHYGELAGLAVVVTGWMIVAVVVFARRSKGIAQAR